MMETSDKPESNPAPICRPCGFRRLKVWQWLLLGLVLAFMLDWFIQRPDSRAREINDFIAAKGSEALRNYPYQFRVLRVEGDTAVIATPRNFDVPAFRFLGVIHPEVNVKNPNDPAFIAIEQELGRVQSEARLLALGQPGIKSTRWELDKPWLQSHGIEVPEGRGR